MAEGQFSSGKVYVQYLGDYDEGEQELTGLSAPNVPGMAGTILLFRRQPDGEGGVEEFPSEKVALGWMKVFNYGKPEPLFKIRYDVIDGAMMAAIQQIVQGKIDGLKDTGYFKRLVRAILFEELKEAEKKAAKKAKADLPDEEAKGDGK